MKNTVVIAAAVGVRMTELGAFEITVRDPEGHTHTTVFLPSTVQGLRDLLIQNQVLLGDWVAVESIGTASTKILKRVAALERSQSAGWSVQAVPTEQTVALAVRDPDGMATLTLLDPAQTLRLAETLHQALGRLDPTAGTAH